MNIGHKYLLLKKLIPQNENENQNKFKRQG